MQFCHRKLCSHSILLSVTLLGPLVALAQVDGKYPPPPAPLTYTYTDGSSTYYVKEGLVVQAPADPPTDPYNAWTRGMYASVAIDNPQAGLPRFIVSWQTDYTRLSDDPPKDYAGILANRFNGDGTCITWTDSGQTYGPKALQADFICNCQNVITCANENYKPSIVMSADGHVRAAWTGHAYYCNAFEPLFPAPHTAATLLRTPVFSFDTNPLNWPEVLMPDPNDSSVNNTQYNPSVGMVGSTPYSDLVAWAQTGVGGDFSTALITRDPATGDANLESNTSNGTTAGKRVQSQFAKCVASREDGTHVVCWTHVEPGYETYDTPPMDIRIQVFAADGSARGSSVTVNEPLDEATGSIQQSPAVSFVGSQIVVVWVGPGLLGMPTDAWVFGRRFTWAGGSATPQPAGDEFLINSDPRFYIEYDTGTSSYANPTVALSQTGNGRFIVAWTAIPHNGDLGKEVHGKYFDGAYAMGQEFRISQDTTRLGYGDHNIVQRQLGLSGQHTVAYGSLGVVCVWNTIDYPIYDHGISYENNRVFFTLLPAGFDDYQAGQSLCCKGDMDGSGGVNGADMQGWIDVYLDPQHATPDQFCRADMNGDGVVDDHFDKYFFIQSLVATLPCPNQDYMIRPYDCDGNGVDDRIDIAADPSLDCNQNGFLDWCETDPDLIFYFGGVTDCNGNRVPDDCDIASGYSRDCNGNGVPDECDELIDCNHNGIPDCWDIADCPPGDPSCADCNHNHIPDSCDIALHHSADRRPHDGIPDECEFDPGPQRPTGGGDGGLRGYGDCADAPADLQAAWDAYNTWADAQDWANSGLSDDEILALIRQKGCELGLVWVLQ